MSIILASLIVILYASAFATFFKRTVCEMLIPAVVCPVFALYLFGLLNFKGCLSIGMGVVSAVALALAAISVKKYGLRGLIKRTELISGAAVFVSILLIAFVMNFNMRIHIWDEFNNWGTRLKYVFMYDALPIYSEPGAWQLNPMCYYPPGTAIASYFFSFTGFVEWKALFSQQLFILLMMTPFLKNAFKKGHLLLNTLFFSSFFLLFGAVNAYATLYVDSFLGILFGFALAYYVLFGRDSDGFGLLITTCTVAMLSLSKDVGFLLSLGICVVMLFDGIVFVQKGESNRLKQVLYRIPALAVAVFSYTSWMIALKIVGAQQLVNVDASDFLHLFSRGQLEPWQSVVRHGMVFEILPKRPVLGGISYIGIVVLFIVFGVIYSTTNGLKTNMFKKGSLHTLACKRNMAWVSIITVGAILYSLFLLYVMCFVHSSWEGSRFHSYERYSLSYLLSIPILCFTLMFPMQRRLELKRSVVVRQKDEMCTINISKKIIKPSLYVIISCCMMLFTTQIAAYLYNTAPPYPLVTNRELFCASPYEEAQKFIPELSDGELTQILTPGDMGFYMQQVRYQLVAPNVSLTGPFSIGEEPYYPDQNDPWTHIVTAEEWGSLLKDTGIKKVLLWDTTPEFIQSYSSMFPGGVNRHTLYRVVQNGDGVVLEEVLV